MANCCNFKCSIILEKSQLDKEAKSQNNSAFPKGHDTGSKNPASLEIYANKEKHSIEYSVLTCLAVLIQRLNNMCAESEMVHLYKYFVLC